MAETKFDPVDFGELVDDPMGVLGMRLQDALPVLGKDPQDVTMRDILGLAFRAGGVGKLGGSTGEHAAKEIGERGLRAGLGAKMQGWTPPSMDEPINPNAMSPSEMRAQYRRRKQRQQENNWIMGDDGRLYQGNTQLAPDVPRDIGVMRGMADDMLMMRIHSPDPNTDELSLYRKGLGRAQQFMDPARNPEWVNRVAESQSLTPGERRMLGYSGD